MLGTTSFGLHRVFFTIRGIDGPLQVIFPQSYFLSGRNLVHDKIRLFFPPVQQERVFATHFQQPVLNHNHAEFLNATL